MRTCGHRLYVHGRVTLGVRSGIGVIVTCDFSLGLANRGLLDSAHVFTCQSYGT